ncbi:MAG: MoaD/ThiS family protein [Chloroflexi bacterium]|nr:MoaD/ThiS family protein [Chloroflexota bacterium]
MSVTFKIGEPLATLVGENSVTVPLGGATTVAGMLGEADRIYPGFYDEVKRGEHDLPYNIFVNDRLVHWEKVAEAPVKDGDKIFLFLAVSGGAVS